jgi:assimilatory nitrate reductase electron transfer subunit
VRPRHLVVIGYGMAGARLADEIRHRDPAGARVRITMVGEEPHLAYNRILLSSVAAGSLPADAARLHDDGWAFRHGIDLRLGTAALSVDRHRRRVVLADGATLDYDVLALATGSTPRLPPVEGLVVEGRLAPGAVSFRTLDDCGRIASNARAGAPVAVLGGGLLGLEVACALADRGSPVTVVHPAPHLMERQLDAGAGRALARLLETRGVGLRLRTGASAYVPSDGLKLTDGGHVEAELVVVSTGVWADTGLAEAAGLATDHGVLVDDALRTSDEAVYALGDCARHAGAEPGTVQPAWEQAAVLAELLTGADGTAAYQGTRTVTRLKARGVELTALGESHTDADDRGADVVCLDDPAGGRYGKLVLREGRVTGAVMLGLPDAAAGVTQLYDRGLPAPADRIALLLGRALPAEAPSSASDAAATPDTAVVCRCNSVRKKDLVSAWRAGARSLSELASATRAGTGCGGCADTVRHLTASLDGA